MPHALAVGKELANQDVVVCWETAGTMHPRLLRRALKLSLENGGCIKFDIKAFDENLHLSLTGGSNRRTLENFAWVASHFSERPSPPPVIASTLLVPGYIDAHEVGQIARFIADQNPDIPYALLAFHPNFMIHDLPLTSKEHALEAQEAALGEGLTNVRLGNMHLLSTEYNNQP
jgi:pyruvate formate lyase activating enzyme